MFTLFVFLAVLGFLVFIHEFGHFYAAKRNGVYSEEFGIGFPPRICGFYKIDGKYRFFFGSKKPQSEDTVYSLNLIPLGGFVRIKGEAGDHADSPDSYAAQGAWPKFQILIAGVTMNFLFAIFALSIGYMVGSPVLVSDEQALQEGVRDPYVTVLEISKDSAAEEAGIQLGDKLLSVNGQELVKSTDLREYIVSTENGEAPVSLEVLRAEAQERITVTPRIDEDGNALIGVALARTGTVSHGFFKSMYYGFIDAVLMGWTILSTFGLLVKQLFLGDTSLAGDVAGPVGIATFTGQVARLGFMHLLNFAAVLSMNLAVLNLLPIPALDGGRILFLIIEKIKGSKINQKTENIVHMIGFGLLMVLIVIVTYRDIVGLLG